jgi:esterase/lipase
MTKIHVYFMPGMAASSKIFERIQLPNDIFEMHLLEWVIPNQRESLKFYAERMAKNVLHENAVLIGVSFGGILVQEMKQFLNPKKVIIISSVKSNVELPRRLKIAKTTKAYKLIPTKLFENIEFFYFFGNDALMNNIVCKLFFFKSNFSLYSIAVFCFYYYAV